MWMMKMKMNTQQENKMITKYLSKACVKVRVQYQMNKTIQSFSKNFQKDSTKFSNNQITKK